MNRITAILALALLAAQTSAQETPSSRLPLEVTGPVQISPWVSAQQPTADPHKNHYLYAPPAPHRAIAYYTFPIYHPRHYFRPAPRVTIINNYNYFHR